MRRSPWMPGRAPSRASRRTPSGLLWAYPVVTPTAALTIAVENGIVGLLAALAVIVLVTRGLLRTIRLTSVSIPGSPARPPACWPR